MFGTALLHVLQLHFSFVLPKHPRLHSKKNVESKPNSRFFLCSTSRGTLGFGFLYFLVELERNYPSLPLITHYLYVSVSIYSFRQMLSILRRAFVLRVPPPPWKLNVAAPILSITGGAPRKVPPSHCRQGPGPPPRRRAMKVEAGTCIGRNCARQADLCTGSDSLPSLVAASAASRPPLRSSESPSTSSPPPSPYVSVPMCGRLVGSLSFSAAYLACFGLWDATNLLWCCYRNNRIFNWIVRSRESPSSQIDLE